MAGAHWRAAAPRGAACGRAHWPLHAPPVVVPLGPAAAPQARAVALPPFAAAAPPVVVPLGPAAAPQALYRPSHATLAPAAVAPPVIAAAAAAQPAAAAQAIAAAGAAAAAASPPSAPVVAPSAATAEPPVAATHVKEWFYIDPQVARSFETIPSFAFKASLLVCELALFFRVLANARERVVLHRPSGALSGGVVLSFSLF